MHRRIAALLICALMALSLGGAWAEASLSLPSELREIGAEAFMGLPGPGKVTVPEGVEVIGSRAFAESGITEIALPASLKTIANDAFQDSSITKVTAPEGSTAWTWAVARGYIKVPLSVTVGCGATTALTGDPVTWTASAQGGSGSYRYRFELSRGASAVYTGSYAASGSFTYAMTQPGSYTLTCTVSDGTGTASATSALTVTSVDALTLLGIEAAAPSSYLATQTHSWTANATGGTPPYRYRFQLAQGSKSLATRDYSASADYSYTFTTAGQYSLKVTVKDSAGDTASDTLSFTASPTDSAVNGVIRIYLHCTSSGEVRKDTPGHYELMLDNGDEGIVFDAHQFSQPVFSYNSAGGSGGSGSGGVVTIYESSVMPWEGAYLYSYTFPTTASKVMRLLDTTLTEWLNTSAEKWNFGGLQYPVTISPFKTYSVSSANCFTALANWTSVLGYPTITEIATKHKNDPSGYYAWRLYDQFKDYWRYEGRV